MGGSWFKRSSTPCPPHRGAADGLQRLPPTSEFGFVYLMFWIVALSVCGFVGLCFVSLGVCVCVWVCVFCLRGVWCCGSLGFCVFGCVCFVFVSVCVCVCVCVFVCPNDLL